MKSLTLLLMLLGSAAAQDAAPAECKPIPGDGNWPADEIWTREIPGVVKSPPKQGNATRPDFVLIARNPADVQAAVKFVGKHNVRLSIINSGHDFLGRNDAPNGLWLNVANLKGVRVAQSFKPSPSGVSAVDYTLDPVNKVNRIQHVPGKQPVVTFGAGVATQELNNALHKSGLFTLGAASGTVRTAGGYGQTSGHAPFSGKYGLAADNFVEFKVVTADGVLRVANSAVEADLFWALRGGGGGTFGVVVEATMNAFPSPKITMTKWWLKTTGTNDTKGIFDPAAYLHSQFPALNARGVQGYYFIYPTSVSGSFWTIDESGIERAKELWKPVFAGMEKFPGVGKVIYQYTNYGSYKDWFDRMFGPMETSDNSSATPELEGAYPHGIIRMDSRLLSASHLTSPTLAAALEGSMPKLTNGMLRGHLVGGGKVLVPREDTSVAPAWRSTLVHLIGTGAGAPDTTPLKELAPDTGCYSNECSSRETSFKSTMFGRQYERLYSIKTSLDPDGVFWVTPGVAADDFSIVDGRLCKVPTNGIGTLGMAPETDNRNFARREGSQYRKFPESQEAADQDALKPGGGSL